MGSRVEQSVSGTVSTPREVSELMGEVRNLVNQSTADATSADASATAAAASATAAAGSAAAAASSVAAIIPPDPTLAIEGRAAEAKATGDALREIRMAVGTPLVASTIADMTDQTKAYVYTGSETGYTAGNWYYYDTSLTTPAWVSGGVYNSTAFETDKTLTVPGAAADAKVTGDKLTDLKSALLFNDLYEIQEHAGYLHSDGSFSDGRYHSLATNLIPCTEGDVFYYKGNASSSAVSALFYSDETTILSSSNDDDLTGYIPITIPENCHYVKFSSFESVDSSIIFDVYGHDSIKYDLNDLKTNTETDINELKSDVENLSHNVGSYHVSEHAGYLTESGTYSNSQYHSLTTDLIPCTEGDIFLYKGKSSTAAVSAIFYSDETTILSVSHSGNVNSYTEITIPESCNYVLFSSYNNVGSDVVLDVNTSDSLRYLLDNTIIDTNNCKSFVTYYSALLFTDLSHYISEDGTFKPSQNFKISDFIKVKSGDVINYRLYNHANIGYVIGLYSAPDNKTFLSGVRATNDVGTYTCENDGFVVIGTSKTLSPEKAYYFVNNRITYNTDISYWQDEIDDSVDKIIDNKLSIGKNIFEFFFISDTHWDENAQKSGLVMTEVSKSIGNDLVVFGGDAITMAKTTVKLGAKEILSNLQAFDGMCVFSTMGNHETNTESLTPHELLSDSQLYPIMFERMETFANNYKDYLCSYIDNPTQKVRLIEIKYWQPNSMVNSNVLTWVTSKINELDTDWNVFVVYHSHWTIINSEKIIPTNAKNLATTLFGLNNGVVKAIFVGHIHSDNVDWIEVDSTTHGTKPVISITTDSIGSNNFGGPTMTLHTDTEQAFDYVQIDLDNNTIYMTRIGAGQDREFTYA